jgi:hypothetical protein
MHAPALHDTWSELGEALVRPDRLLARWRDRHLQPELRPPTLIFPALAGLAAVGLFGFGLSLGQHAGALATIHVALATPLAAGLAWLISVPALHVLESSAGARVDPSSTLLLALVVSAFASVALLSAAPITWFFALAAPARWVRLAVLAPIALGTSIATVDAFRRARAPLEPRRHLPSLVWLGVLGLLGLELAAVFGVTAIVAAEVQS